MGASRTDPSTARMAPIEARAPPAATAALLPAARDPPEVASPVGFNFVVVIANPHPSLLARRARRVPRSVAGFDPSHPVGPTLLWSVQEPDA